MSSVFGRHSKSARQAAGRTAVLAVPALVFCLWFPPSARAEGGGSGDGNDIFAAGYRVFSSTELIERARELDGGSIMYQGEAVGEVMYRGESAWINLHDGDNAIGIWCEKAAAERVKHCGNYRCSGDQCLVTGIFNRACPEHGGTLDIHARELIVLTRGEKTVHAVTPAKKRLAATVAVPAVLLAVYYIFRRRRIK